eukprot:gnl/TRDRNA2_/TRDRNA2_168802_c3_seq1.p1 gnl/TRDRNA2_/TRDRNA2_168802_c3~~gnl/TRDRNA2_/TRDRNA2_168802_c3_seq1.p1  ORF type:complete len:506 (-),score=104.37 gnl/TRDRNA2_/TRDRNA2_168802_c3_seq1:90-1439(-)
MSAVEAANKEEDPPRCRTDWLRGSSQLCLSLTHIAGKAVENMWDVSRQLASSAIAHFSMEFHYFLETIIFSVETEHILRCLNSTWKPLQLNSLMLISVFSSLRLPLTARTIESNYVRRYHDVQQQLIEGLAEYGEGSYDLVARWLFEPPGGLPCEADFRCLVAFMIGQCVSPPLAVPPSLDVENQTVPLLDPNASTATSDEEKNETELRTVAECAHPPAVLLDRIAQEVLNEDSRLRKKKFEMTSGAAAPIFSTFLCHQLYTLASMVPFHPEAASSSPSVRAAAFAQLMKIQNIVAQGTITASLYDEEDGDRAKLYLYIRATACVRSALQTIMGSWFAANYGGQFAIAEEGGKDFIQYCTRQIIQTYNNKTALTKVMGTPWERLMLSQGPSATIAELLMAVCSTDKNLLEVGRLGGQQALHSLSRFGETNAMRQKATMLLTKLAILAAP